jgi:hypothetical protein
MSKQRSHELPEDIIERLRRVVAFTGNEKAVDEDPVKVLSMLLCSLEERLSVNSIGAVRFAIQKYCSAEGMVLYADALQKRKAA